MQRRGEESSEMEQISIIERFPYPFQVRYFLSPALKGTCNVIIRDRLQDTVKNTRSQWTEFEENKEAEVKNETDMG